MDSRGLLSWVSLDPVAVKQALEESARMAERIRERRAMTVVVFTTGAELANGQVMDTNSPAIRDKLSSEGYSVSFGPTLKDDEYYISGAFTAESRGRVNNLVITTGGVGAEDKDQTKKRCFWSTRMLQLPPL